MAIDATSKLILVVDDEPEMLKAIATALALAGLRVETVENPGFVASKVSRTHYDAIITDLKMPNVDGPTVVRNVRASKENRKTPVFVISGAVDRVSLQAIQALGVQGVLVKPFDLQELVQKVLQSTGSSMSR